MYPSDADRIPESPNGETQETHTPFSQEPGAASDLPPTQARISQEGPTTPFLAPPPFDEPLYTTSDLPQQAARPQW
ncbi:MAG TPA: hypothetical protein VKB76_03640, partial [Ktedonobacterales bacterium]|nr:hypothetical protein [Ktedonobacterales bacterium]